MFSSVIGKLKEAGRWIGQNPIKSSLIGAAIAVTGGAALAYGMGAFGGTAAGAAGTAAVAGAAEAAAVAPAAAVVPAALPYTNELLNRFARNPGALGMNFRPGGYN